MYAIRTIVMVDDPAHGYTNPRYGIPLVKQRYHGKIIPLIHLTDTMAVD